MKNVRLYCSARGICLMDLLLRWGKSIEVQFTRRFRAKWFAFCIWCWWFYIWFEDEIICNFLKLIWDEKLVCCNIKLVCYNIKLVYCSIKLVCCNIKLICCNIKWICCNIKLVCCNIIFHCCNIKFHSHNINLLIVQKAHKHLIHLMKVWTPLPSHYEWLKLRAPKKSPFAMFSMFSRFCFVPCFSFQSVVNYTK